MYEALIFYHSLFRWLVLAGLIYAIFRSIKGLQAGRQFSKWDNLVRHSSATIAHIQLVIGIVLYSKSPLTSYMLRNFAEAKSNFGIIFFGTIHALMMLTAVVIITIGSSLAKRRETSVEKFRTIVFWYSIALLFIFIAIPWPFSPLSQRPYFR